MPPIIFICSCSYKSKDFVIWFDVRTLFAVRYLPPCWLGAGVPCPPCCRPARQAARPVPAWHAARSWRSDGPWWRTPVDSRQPSSDSLTEAAPRHSVRTNRLMSKQLNTFTNERHIHATVGPISQTDAEINTTNLLYCLCYNLTLGHGVNLVPLTWDHG